MHQPNSRCVTIGLISVVINYLIRTRGPINQETEVRKRIPKIQENTLY